MKPKITTLFLSLIMLATVISIEVPSNVSAAGMTFYVDDDNVAGPWDGSIAYPYQTINDALTAGTNGDTISVFNGTYLENVIVDRSLTIIGNGTDNTTIDGGGGSVVVQITADTVNITGFTITNGNRGINITSDYVTISNTNITSIQGANGGVGEDGLMGAGIYIDSGSNINISINNISDVGGGNGGGGPSGGSGAMGTGIYIDSGFNINISNNEIFDISGGNGGIGDSSGGSGGMGAGIYLQSCTNNNITNNFIKTMNGGSGGSGNPFASGGSGGIGVGIYLQLCTNNNVTNNSIETIKGGSGGWGDTGGGGSGGMGAGIYLHTCEINTIINNSIETINAGIGGSDPFDSGGSGGKGLGIYLHTCTHNTIINNTIKTINAGNGGNSDSTGFDGGSGGTGVGLYLPSCTNNIIINNFIITINAGNGGQSGSWGVAGSGGMVAGIYLDSSLGTNISNNEIFSINGGSGRDSSYDFIDGGVGGNGVGLYLQNSMNNTMNNNNINTINGGTGGAASGGSNSNGGEGGNGKGICLQNSINNTIMNNTINTIYGGNGGGTIGGPMGVNGGAGGTGAGIYFQTSRNNIIINNSIKTINGGLGGFASMTIGQSGGPGGIGAGVYLQTSKNNTIINNSMKIINGGMSGAWGTSDSNDLIGLGAGIYFYTSPNNIITRNIIDTINGSNGQDKQYEPEIGRIGAGIFLYSSNGTCISYNELSNITGGNGGDADDKGGDGGLSAGIYAHLSLNSSIKNNSIHIINGGNGGESLDDMLGAGGHSMAIYLQASYGDKVMNNSISSINGGNGGGTLLGSAGGNAVAIQFENSINNTFKNNSINLINGGNGGPGGLAIGIYSQTTSKNSITNNSINSINGGTGIGDNSAGNPGGLGAGIYFHTSTNNIIMNNTIGTINSGNGGNAMGSGGSGGMGAGIYLQSCTNNTIVNNSIKTINAGNGGEGWSGPGGSGGMGAGIYLQSSTNSTIINNTINTIIGAASGATTEWMHPGIVGGLATGIYLQISPINIVKNNYIDIINGGGGGNAFWEAEGGSGGIGAGLYFFISTDNIISYNTIKASDGGAGGNGDSGYPDGEEGFGTGIYLHNSTINNISNDYYSNSDCGIFLNSSSNNIFNNNTCVNNGVGIRLNDSTNNRIYHNNFVNNTIQAADTNSTKNYWHHTELLEGNFWSDYTGLDDGSGTGKHAISGDGIGDTNISHPSTDYDSYPFMWPMFGGPVHNIDTDKYYNIIQNAIDDPVTLNGHTIEVEAGVYYENVVIDKILTLIGVSVSTTIVDGNGSGDVIKIFADWVNVTGFTFRNSGGSFDDAGIELNNVQNCLIFNNTVSWNDNCGIYLDSSSMNNITGNTISNNDIGICLSYAIGNTISHNTILGGGIFVEGDLLEQWNTHDINNNIVNNKPIYYWKNQNGGTVPMGAGQIILANCTNVKIQSQDLTNVTIGIELGFSSINTIIGNNVSSNFRYGILLYQSSNNKINDCILFSNNIYGIRAEANSQNNIVTNSTILNSGTYDFYLGDNANITVINSSFNKSKVYFDDSNSTLIVKWYMHVYLESTDDIPMSNATINVTDFLGVPINGSPYNTGDDEFARWICVIEYIQNGTNGGSPSGNNIQYFTPHNVTVSNYGIIRYAESELVMDFSKDIIILFSIIKPVADAGFDISTMEDMPLIFDGSGSKFDGNILNYTWDFGDGNIGYGSNPSHVYENRGVYVVILNITDGFENCDLDSVVVYVNNPIPMANAGQNKTDLEGNPIIFNASVSDDNPSDKPNLIYTWDFGDGNIGHGITTAHTYEDDGNYTVTLEVTDDNGDISYSTIWVNISNVPPTIELISEQITNEGELFTLKVNATDVSKDTLSHFDNTTLFDIDPATGVIKFTSTNSDVQTHSVKITVKDEDGGESYIVILFTIMNINDIPELDQIGGQITFEDQLFTLTATALDPDVGDTLTYSDDTSLFDIDPITGIISFTPKNEDVGEYSITITVDDGKGGIDSETFKITVLNMNDAPDFVIPATVTYNLKAGEKFTLDIDAIDSDIGDSIFFLDDSLMFQIDSITGEIAFTPTNDDDGTHEVVIKAIDSEGAEDSLNLTFNVVAVEPSLIENIGPSIPWFLLFLVIGIIFGYLIATKGRKEKGIEEIYEEEEPKPEEEREIPKEEPDIFEDERPAVHEDIIEEEYPESDEFEEIVSDEETHNEQVSEAILNVWNKKYDAKGYLSTICPSCGEEGEFSVLPTDSGRKFICPNCKVQY